MGIVGLNSLFKGGEDLFPTGVDFSGHIRLQFSQDGMYLKVVIDPLHFDLIESFREKSLVFDIEETIQGLFDWWWWSTLSWKICWLTQTAVNFSKERFFSSSMTISALSSKMLSAFLKWNLSCSICRNSVRNSLRLIFLLPSRSAAWKAWMTNCLVRLVMARYLMSTLTRKMSTSTRPA